MSPSQIKSEL